MEWYSVIAETDVSVGERASGGGECLLERLDDNRDAMINAKHHKLYVNMHKRQEKALSLELECQQKQTASLYTAYWAKEMENGFAVRKTLPELRPESIFLAACPRLTRTSKDTDRIATTRTATKGTSHTTNSPDVAKNAKDDPPINSNSTTGWSRLSPPEVVAIIQPSWAASRKNLKRDERTRHQHLQLTTRGSSRVSNSNHQGSSRLSPPVRGRSSSPSFLGCIPRLRKNLRKDETHPPSTATPNHQGSSRFKSSVRSRSSPSFLGCIPRLQRTSKG
eukprot:gene26917-4540_t